MTVVLVSTPFDNFRIECPQRHGVQRLNIRMAESQGYKRTDAVFSISCGNIQDLSPWDTIPDSIADMEYEDCHYTESFDPILEKNKNVTCGTRKYLSGITRISGTKTSLMCCKLRTRDVSKCIEKQFEKPLDNVGFVEIQHEGMLINGINIMDNSYSIKFCNFMPRAVGFIYDEVATLTPRPTTTIPTSTTEMVTQTISPIENHSQSMFPRLISSNELKSITNQNVDFTLRNNFQYLPNIKEQIIKSDENNSRDMIKQEFVPMMIDFEEGNNNQAAKNELNFNDDNSKLINFINSSNSNNYNDEHIEKNLNIPSESINSKLSKVEEFQDYNQKEELINDGRQTEITTSELKKENSIGNITTIETNSNENILPQIEPINNLPTINSSSKLSYNTQYRHIQTNPIIIEEEIISNHSSQLKALKSSEKKELHSNSYENNINILNSLKSAEELPRPSPFPTISMSTFQSLSSTNTPSNEKIDIAKATVAKLHYSLKYNKKYNHSRSAFGSKIFKASEDNEVKQENETTTNQLLLTTTTKYSTTPYIPRMSRKLKNKFAQNNVETFTKDPITYETTTQKSSTTNNFKNIEISSMEIKPKYTNKELNEMEKNTNIMISKVDEFAQIPFDETFVPKDSYSNSEKKYESIREPIQEAINEQYHFNGYPSNDFSTKVTHYQPPVNHKRLNKPQPSSTYYGKNIGEDDLEESNNYNKGPTVDEDTDNSPFDEPIDVSLLQSQQEMKSSNLKHTEELEPPKGIDRDIIPQNYLTSHDIRRAPQKTHIDNLYHPNVLERIRNIPSTLPPLTIFKHEHKETLMPLQPLTVIKEDIDTTKRNYNNDDSLTTTIANSEYLLKENNSNNEKIENNLNTLSKIEETKTSLLTTTEITTTYNASVFYKVPRIKIPRKKERYLTFCTKEEAIRDENNLVIACGGDYDIWIPPRCPQGSSCFLTSDSTYRICCPVSSG
ncbi:Hypothetical protein SRAE_X000127700 [Strongyloides ratti]|uniref:Uncharacterized protein n=1 Tax=Strongyloides ratti TaxID=34506 RepID=A0A090KUI0_STRRB|nr:Hypothetical protein SRAE_X000127700 [Strongyloides ratti]CEF59530.1 Hypothetical protein SRAE_X000127700 [Strongyloides ratti]